MFPLSASSPAAPRVGLEPTTLRLTAGCSTIELSRIILYPENCISNLMNRSTLFLSFLCVSCSTSLVSFRLPFKKLSFACEAASCKVAAGNLLNKLLDLLVPVSSIHLCTYTSGLSPCRLQGVLLFSDGISLLEVGFTLRCLQRLSLPDLATLLYCWSVTDTPAVCPFRSSRTKNSSSQISYAHDG